MTQLLPLFVMVGAVAFGVVAMMELVKGRGIARKHWFGFLLLIPFPCMLAVHEWMGMSDALMAAAEPGERPAQNYNLVMVGVFYAGVAGYVFQTWKLASESRGWLAVKHLVLAAYWAPFLL